MRRKLVPPELVKHRRTQAAMLGEPSKDQRRLIKDIAKSADLPIQRVFRDVLSAGLSVFASPESSPYRTIIEFRQELEQREAAFYDKQNDGESSGGNAFGPGSADQYAGNGTLAAEADEKNDPAFDWLPRGSALGQQGEERPGDAVERPGLERPDEERDPVFDGLMEASPSDDDESPIY